MTSISFPLPWEEEEQKYNRARPEQLLGQISRLVSESGPMYGCIPATFSSRVERATKIQEKKTQPAKRNRLESRVVAASVSLARSPYPLSPRLLPPSPDSGDPPTWTLLHVASPRLASPVIDLLLLLLTQSIRTPSSNSSFWSPYTRRDCIIL
jgi:hypothetical protein